MIFKKIGNMENVEAICHYLRFHSGPYAETNFQYGVRDGRDCFR